MNKSFIFIYLLAFLLCSLCNAQTSARVEFSTQCLGVEEDGSQTVRAWGFGKKKSDAIEQAKKNAVRDVLFRGIQDGMEGCNTRPIINEPNAREKHAAYFNKFFSDDGKYEKYVSTKDEKRKSREHVESSMGTRWSVVLRIDCWKLKERMIKDGILPKPNQK